MKILSLFLFFSLTSFAGNDPNFPPDPTVGKFVKASHPTTNQDKDFVANLYSPVESGSQFTDFVLLNPDGACAEGSGTYFKYSAMVDSPSLPPATQYMLVSAVGTQPPMGPAVNPGFNGLGVGKPVPNNAISWSPGNSVIDCHSSGSSTGAEFWAACDACGSSYPGGLLACYAAVNTQGYAGNPGFANGCASIGGSAGDWACACTESGEGDCSGSPLAGDCTVQP